MLGLITWGLVHGSLGDIRDPQCFINYEWGDVGKVLRKVDEGYICG